MLYDPKWEKKIEAKADPYSLNGLIAWLEKQPAKARYDWTHPAKCLLGQFCVSVGEVDVIGKSLSLPRGGDSNPYARVALNGPFTFGAALERARAALSLLNSTEQP